MNDEQLDRCIKTIGMGCFAKYFEAFNDASKDDEGLIDALMKLEGYEESGAKARVSQSRRIIREGRDRDALEMITNSQRVEYWVVSKANFLID